ncbi:small ribosomal subunit Rsm22 family protein [Candidatus Paracaedibacter symbiosus]|uniref:small ribosomal subunit Rsm22 family protein n=1 Tax=Candidatus Paracaedibacter symbiosus TaxID=244582 RepID=UPI00068A38B4|nr:small ribosomal subunit Rsm22 family protein [Candidatus Paracaedibacter symbiosus]
MLDQWLEELLAGYSDDQLLKAYQGLSHRYRQENYIPGFQSDGEVKAYAAARMPATVAAISQIFRELPADFSPTSILDLGAGTGAASLTALTYFPNVTHFKLVEQDGRALAAARQLLEPLSKAGSYLRANLKEYVIDQPTDFVILSYVLNELKGEEQSQVLERVLLSQSRYVLIVMPGTPLCFKQLLGLRGLALASGYRIAAPCSHHQTCPMAKDPWCHFKVRLPRTRLHRAFKKAALNFEDEKFCYLLLSKDPTEFPGLRIVKNPIHRSGHSIFDVCEPHHLKRFIIARKHKDLYKKISKREWGDIL